MQQLLCFLHKSMDTSNQSQLADRPTQTRYIILAGGSVGAQWRQPPPVQWESLILLKLPSARWTLPAHTKYNPSLVPPPKKFKLPIHGFTCSSKTTDTDICRSEKN